MEIIVVIGGPLEEGAIRRWLHQQLQQKDNQKFHFIGVDGGCLKLMEEELTIDLAIGDFDSISVEDKEILKNYASNMIEFPSEKDFTDFEEALMWVAKVYPQQKIHVLGAFGGRVDHAISCLWTMFRPELQVLIPYLSLEDEWNHISFLIPGDYVIEKLDYTKYLSFITTGPIEQLTLKNVKYTLSNQDYDFPIALISNEFIEDKMKISFKSGGIIVGQTRDSWR
ncbi:thiamine diphosphokinase [uncultured Granulicatella sp.]|uniref:thiamine diphosphokinase n=1 Tax=uncultured Granulicatella sp. TaxID=316089 RepID=UPI0028F13B84|nr:thiamine diphosphokinase [uncultured Granulicatella sp.]